jgi:hypothetical protein
VSVPQGGRTGSAEHDEDVTSTMNAWAADGWSVLSVIRGDVIGPVCITFVRD